MLDSSFREMLQRTTQRTARPMVMLVAVGLMLGQAIPAQAAVMTYEVTQNNNGGHGDQGNHGNNEGQGDKNDQNDKNDKGNKRNKADRDANNDDQHINNGA